MHKLATQRLTLGELRRIWPVRQVYISYESTYLQSVERGIFWKKLTHRVLGAKIDHRLAERCGMWTLLPVYTIITVRFS
jgi:hypothetical protein